MQFKRFTHLGPESPVELQTEDLRGFQIFDSTGKFVGVVDDLLVDMESTSIDYALVGQGNIAIMLNGKDLIVPLDNLSIDSDKRSARLDVTLDQLWDFPPYSSLEDPDLKGEVDEFWADAASHPVPHDVTLPHPASLESPLPIPPEVAQDKMPAGNPRIAAGLESPVKQEVIDYALSHMPQEEPKAPEEPGVTPIRPEAEKEKEERGREKPAA